MPRPIVDVVIPPRRSTRCGPAVALVCALGSLVIGCSPPPLAPSAGDDVPSITARAATIATWPLLHGWRVSPTLAAPAGATRVAALVRVAPGALVALQARVVANVDVADDDTADENENENEWRPLTVTWRDRPGGDGHFVAVVDLPRVARAIQLRVAADDVARLRSLTLEAIVPEARRPLPPTGDTPLLTTTTVTQAVLDGYEPRAAWGARAPAGCDTNPSKTKVTIHHTVSPLHEGGTRNEFTAELRGIQALHMDGRGYCDVGYHFLVTSDGTVWEARNVGRLGAHTGGQNTNNLGISFVGCFHPTSDCSGLGSTTPPQAMLNGAGAFLGRVIRHYGITLSQGSTFFGHRDNPGQSTACPGDLLHDRLDDLQALAEGGSTPPATTGRVQGTVWNLAVTDDVTQSAALEARLPGAVVTATQGGRTVATATARDGDAYWFLDVPPGTTTIAATLDDFAPTTRSLDIASGDERWSSLGLTPSVDAVAVRVVVVDAVTNAPLPLATVQFGADDPVVVDGEGQVTASLPPGPVVIVARAESYEPRTEEPTLVAGTPLNLTLGLDAAVLPDPPDDDAPTPPAGDDDDELQRLVIRNSTGVRATGGCTCAASTGNDDVAFVVAALFVLRLRRRR
jgi:hypothetical protein